MSKSTALYLPTGANNSSVKFVNADGTTAKTVFTAAAEGSDLKSLIAAMDDGTTRNVVINVVRSAVTYVLGKVNVPLTAGTTGAIPSVDLLNSTLLPGLPLDDAGKPYLPLKYGDTVTVAPDGAITAAGAKTLWISAFGQDY